MPRQKKTETEAELTKEVKDPSRPLEGSPEWTRYVLNKLKEDEVIEGNPKIDGLRRIATDIYGRFQKTHRFDYMPDVWDGSKPVVMTCQLKFKNGIIIEGSAEVWGLNTPPQYMNYPVSSADTRSEGKALKLALGLTKTLTYEEMEQAVNNTDPVNDSLISMLKTVELRTGISAEKTGILLAGDKFKSIEELTIEQARRIIEKMNEINARGTPEQKERTRLG